MNQQSRPDPQSRRKPPSPSDYGGISPHLRFSLLGFFVATLVAVTSRLGAHLPPLISALIGINGATLFLCGFDKSIAGGKTRRVPERTFLSFALFGGSLGLLIGMLLFRHKTRKSSFILGLAVVFMLQLLLLRSETMSALFRQEKLAAEEGYGIAEKTVSEPQ